MVMVYDPALMNKLYATVKQMRPSFEALRAHGFTDPERQVGELLLIADDIVRDPLARRDIVQDAEKLLAELAAEKAKGEGK